VKRDEEVGGARSERTTRSERTKEHRRPSSGRGRRARANGGNGANDGNGANGPLRARRPAAALGKESLASGRRTRENAKELANSGACVLVRGFVLRDDVRRNAPALIDLVSALLRPRADLRTALAARAGAGPAAPGRRTCFARVLHIVGELFTKLACVAGTEIDLIRGAIKPKRYGLCSLAPIEIIDEKHLYLLCHRIGPSDGATYFR